MNIIFGDVISELPDSFTVLELDTFRILSEDRIATAYCVVEQIPIEEFAKLEAYKKIHTDLINSYKGQHWTYCEHAIEALMGRWNGELDTFYTDLLARVMEYKQNPPGEGWTAIRDKS
jgi:hypothetical protein